MQDRNAPSGPLVRELLHYCAGSLFAFGAAESEAFAPINAPLFTAAALVALGNSIPVAVTPSLQATAVDQPVRGAVVGIKAQHRVAGGGAVGETVTYVAMKLSADQLTLTTLLQPDGVTPIQVVVPSTSTVPVRLGVSPSAFAAFAAGDQLLLVAVHGVLTVSGPTIIAADIEFVLTAAN